MSKVSAITMLTVHVLFGAVQSAQQLNAEPIRPNVLLIAVDDMNDWVGCLEGHPDARSPNIDRLAERGTLFTNAHCQAPICNPSRTSIMYGMRPSTTGVYMNSPRPWTVAKLDDAVTLPAWFAKHGYQTYTTGKIYHGSGLPPEDFSVVGPRPGQRLKIDARLVPPTEGGAKGLWDWGAQSYAEDKFQDHADASWAIEVLNSHGAANGDTVQPFFLAVGFYRPHVPFYSPKRLLQQIPLADIDLPIVDEHDRADLPPIVDKVAVAPVAPPHSYFVESGRWKEAVQAYLSCIRWTDEQVGRLLTALDNGPHSENTVVVFYSDHGFFLGEKQRWAKQSLWERATHVPFIIAAPGMPARQRCGRPTELLSIYPTLLDLCGLPQNAQLEGRTLRPLLQDAAAAWPWPALTTHGRNNHTVRSEKYRYIRYENDAEELYDITNDPSEWRNLAADGFSKEEADVVAELRQNFPRINAANSVGDKAKKNKKPKSALSRRTKESGNGRANPGTSAKEERT